MNLKNNPPTLRATRFREAIKARLLSGHLRIFPRDEKTLDIGCGWGFSLRINPNFYCIDGDQDCIDYLQSVGAKAFLADVSGALPFEDGFFDNAFTHDVLEHLEESEMASLFTETRRVLRPGGLFMNVVPNEKGYVAGLSPEVGHKNFIQVREVQRAAAASGFELVKVWYTPLPHVLSEAFAHNKLVTLCRAI